MRLLSLVGFFCLVTFTASTHVARDDTDINYPSEPFVLPPDQNQLAFPIAANSTLTNSTFLILCRNDDLYQVLETIQSIQDRFNSKYNYDYVLLNDKPFTPHFMSTIANFVPKSRVRFGEIPPHHWLYPEWIDQDKAAIAREQLENAGVVYGASESYRHMCRFYSGFFYQQPLLQEYEYYWRLEPGTKLLCDVNYDVFARMEQEHKLYAFTLTIFEYEQTIPSLWGHVKDFMNANPINGDLLPLVQNDDPHTSYNLCHFWSNFEIANLNIFRSHNYTKFFDHLDKTGGFFYERWGDAPIHSLYISLFLDRLEVLHLEDFGYFHSPYYQCPRNENIWKNNRCVCDPEYDFTFSFQSCTPHFQSVLNRID